MAELFAWQTIKTALGNILGAIIAFVSGWPLRAWVGLVLAASLTFWWSGQRGYDHGVADRIARERAAGKQTDAAGRTFIANLTFRDHAAKADLTQEFQAITFTFADIAKEIPQHVTPSMDRDYPVPCGVVRVWDAGSLRARPSELAASQCPSDAAPAPTSASAFSQANADLWKAAWEWRADDLAVRQMYRNLAQEYEQLRQRFKQIKE